MIDKRVILLFISVRRKTRLTDTNLVSFIVLHCRVVGKPLFMVLEIGKREEIPKVMNVSEIRGKKSAVHRKSHAVFRRIAYGVAVDSELVVGTFFYLHRREFSVRPFVNHTVLGKHIVAYRRAKKRDCGKLSAVCARAVYQNVVGDGFYIITLIAEFFLRRYGYRIFYIVRPESDYFARGQIAGIGNDRAVYRARRRSEMISHKLCRGVILRGRDYDVLRRASPDKFADGSLVIYVYVVERTIDLMRLNVVNRRNRIRKAICFGRADAFARFRRTARNHAHKT